MNITVIIIVAVVAALFFFTIAVYNRLVALKNRFQNAFSQIEVQLKRRYDLIPNLVETAKSYMAHERETLEAVTQARNQALAGLNAAKAAPGDKGAMAQLSGAENSLTGALGRLNMVMEAYPDLKASQNMAQLSEELTSTENRVAFSRQAFNDSVMEYNTYKQSFPQVMLAPMVGHGEDASLLEFADSAAIQEAPKVSF
ncbi:LemA family protein [Marinimicrobium sp. ABcell2]|uniref:LemA family protein n=1 Tax=Marinimicrobium sp. ABcell2 TaxID=3069751 RepID=UPI0027B454BE|nr:LemA family protein [Marinimicrobium sp. ABcell2]MDQ2075071.1 LemA family protein [Marinimicrobium sp. ABcell2]